MNDIAIHSWMQLGTFLTAIFVFIWYMRKDSKDDYSRLDVKLKDDYSRLDAKLEAWRRETKEDFRRSEGLLAAIHEEMKDFHARLCVIEEKNKGK